MNILGISNLENSSAAVLVDGTLVAACEEERFTRRKYHQGFPLHAIESCLKFANLAIDDIDEFAVGWVPYSGVTHRIVETLKTSIKDRKFGIKVARGGKYFSIIKEQLFMRGLLMRHFDRRKKVRVNYINHHMSHMACSYFMSGFQDAALLSVDGTGEYETCVLGNYRDESFFKICRFTYPYSLGHLYSVFTSFLGFRPNGGEGKVMGLAPYGKPVYEEVIKSFVTFDEMTCTLTWDPRYVDYSASLLGSFPKAFVSLFGKARQPKDDIEERHSHIAASIQKLTEDILVKLGKCLHSLTNTDNLCLSGGVALNCLANAKIKEQTLFKRLYVPPAPSDAGVSLGAALYLYHCRTGERPEVNGGNPYLGPGYSSGDCLSELKKRGIPFGETDEREKQAALLLSQGYVIGWFQGRMEFGPRALGSRSILAPAYPEDMKDVLNERVKFREGFRPFAPCILEEEVPAWFEDYCDSPYMSFAFPVEPALRKKVPAIVHVNGRARLQTVNRQRNPLMHRLLCNYEKLTGIPILLNTSFNLTGEPIVCTPGDALSCFRRTDMDYLFLDKYIIEGFNQKE